MVKFGVVKQMISVFKQSLMLFVISVDNSGEFTRGIFYEDPSEDSDQMSHSVVTDLCLYCLSLDVQK